MKILLTALIIILIVCGGCSAIPVTPEVSQTTGVSALPESSPTQTLMKSADPSAGPAAAEQTPKVTEALGTPPPLPVITKSEIRYDNEYISVSIEYPQISGMLDAKLKEQINSELREEFELLAASLEEESRADASKPFAYYINASFCVTRNDGTFLSIWQSIDFYSGGAAQGADSRLINLKNSLPGVRLGLEGLFKPDSDYISALNTNISAIIAADPNGQDYMFDTVKANQWFYLTDTQLVIMFRAYEISAGTYGQPEFVIPLEELKDMLIPELTAG